MYLNQGQLGRKFWTFGTNTKLNHEMRLGDGFRGLEML